MLLLYESTSLKTPGSTLVTTGCLGPCWKPSCNSLINTDGTKESGRELGPLVFFVRPCFTETICVWGSHGSLSRLCLQ